MPSDLSLSVLPLELSVCRLAPDAAIPEWATRSSFFCVMRTANELSVVCPASAVPAGVQQTPGWRALQLHGPFAFDETGILEAVLHPLAAAGVGIFALSTYDTDYVLVREAQLQAAVAAIRAAGHNIKS